MKRTKKVSFNDTKTMRPFSSFQQARTFDKNQI